MLNARKYDEYPNASQNETGPGGTHERGSRIHAYRARTAASVSRPERTATRHRCRGRDHAATVAADWTKRGIRIRKNPRSGAQPRSILVEAVAPRIRRDCVQPRREIPRDCVRAT